MAQDETASHPPTLYLEHEHLKKLGLDKMPNVGEKLHARIVAHVGADEISLATVQRIAKSGVTVLIVEQNVRGALLISDRALVMEQGRLFMEGPAAEVRTDPRIRQAYLGGNIQQTAA